MAMNLATAYIDIIPSMGPKGRIGKDVAREFAGVGREASKAGKSSGGAFVSAFKAPLAGIAGAFAAVGIGAFFKDAVQGAGDLEQSIGAIESVFKGSSGQMKNWSRNAARDVGLTSNEFNELGTVIGSQLKNGGTAMEDLAPKTKGLIDMGADLSSMFGGTTKEAIEAMSSALRGESDPIERYGVSLSAARVEAKAAALGFSKVGTEYSQQAKQAAILALITDQTADAQGNFGRESDTFAHKQQVMTAEWGNLTTKIGELFLPALTTTFAFISDKVIPVFGEVVGGVKAFTEAFKAGDGDITSSGFPGFMERLGGAARGLYDLFKGDYNPVLRKAFGWEEDNPAVVGILKIRDGAQGLYDLLVKGDYNGSLRRAFGWEEDNPAVDKLLKLRDTAGEIPGKFKEFKDAAVAALKEAGDWLVKNKDWLGALAISVGSVVAAYKTYTTALALHSAVVGIYAAISSAAGGAQAFFAGAAFTAALGVTALNTALKANLFGIIALAVIGLVSGLVWFFTQTEAGKAIVAAAWEGIQKVVGAVVDWFTKTALPAIQGFIGGIVGFFEDLGRNTGSAFKGVQDGVDGVVSFFTGTVAPAFQTVLASVGAIFKSVFDGIGAVFNWFYQSVVIPVVNGVKFYIGIWIAVFQGIYNFLKPVFDSLGVIINGFRMFFEGVFNLVVAYVQKIVIPLFMMFWNRMVEAFNGVTAAISGWWTGVVAVFTAVGQAISNWWAGVVGLFNEVVSYVRTVLAAVFTWYLNNVILPVWNAVTGAIRTAWTNISNVFNTVVTFIRGVLSTAFTWFRDSVVTPVWNTITSIVRTAWTNISGVFNSVVSFIQTNLSAAFTWFRDNVIKPVWDRIQNIIKNVWEQDIKPVFNTLSDFITKTIPKAFDTGVAAIKKAWEGIQEVAKAPVRFVINTVINDGLIAGFNNLARPLGVKELVPVGLPAGFAEGGYTGPGGKYQPAGIVHAGEVVWSQDDIARWGGVGVVEAMRRAAGFAKGGIVNPLKAMALTQGYNRVHKGIDLAAAVGTPVFASQSGRVTWAGPGVQAPGVWGGNEIHIDGGSGVQEWFAHLSSIGVKLGQMVRGGQQIGLSGNTGITSGPHLHFGTFAGGWPNDIDPLAYLGGAGIPSGGGFNPIQGIIDGLMSKIKEAGGGPFADIAIGIGKKVIDSASKFVTDFLSGNRDKGSATATLFDGGGWLENTGGAQLVQHNKRKPDAVLSSTQWDTMTRIADNAKGAGFHNYGTIHVRDEEEMARIITTRQRDAQAAYGF